MCSVGTGGCLWEGSEANSAPPSAVSGRRPSVSRTNEDMDQFLGSVKTIFIGYLSRAARAAPKRRAIGLKVNRNSGAS